MAQTQLPGSMGYIDWTGWTRGLLTAFIGGGAGAVQTGFSTIVVDPKDFNIYTAKLYIVMAAAFVFSGLVSMAQFLHSKPIPEYIKTTEVEERSPHKTVVTGTGDGGTIEERSLHSTKVTKVVEEVKPVGTTTTVIDPPKTTITETPAKPEE